MKPRPHPRRWRTWMLAGALAFGAVGLTARPAPAKPGFGTVSDDDRAKQKAEQEKRAEERRQQEKARESERQAERDRQTQERARQDQQRESERRAQREQAERDRGQRQQTERDRAAQRERDRQVEREREAQARAQRDRAAREAQARAERDREAQARGARERADREAQARSARERAHREGQARADRERTEREAQARAAREREAQEAAAREARAREEQRRTTERTSREPERPRPGFGRRPAEEPRRDPTPTTPTQPASQPRDRTPDGPTESPAPRPRPGFGRRSESRPPTETTRPDESLSQPTGRSGAGSRGPEHEAPPPSNAGRPAVTQPPDRTPDRLSESSSPRRRPGFGTRPETSQPAVRPGPGGLPEGQAVRLGSPAPSVPGLRDDPPGSNRRGGRADRPPENSKGNERKDKIPFGVRRPNQATRNGSLDRYFNPRSGAGSYRLGGDRERHGREHTAYRHDRRYRHHRRYDDCPYDVIYIPPPVVIYEPPRTEVVVIPSPEPVLEREYEEPRTPERPDSPSRQLARASTLDEVIADVEEAWLAGNLPLLMQHVRDDRPLEVYREGEFTSALSWEQFRDKTREAFQRYETLAMRFAAPRMLSDTEAVVSAEHRFREPGGEEQRVRVVYALTKEHGAWWIAGLDYLPLQRSEPRPQPRPAVARPRAVAPTLAQVSLVKAQPIRWASLKSQARPTLLATLRGVSGGRAALYDLKVMRGIHPGTLSWALYRRGQARPLEVGILEPRPVRAGAWVAVKIARYAATPTATMARVTSSSRPGPTVFPIRTLGGAKRLTLTEVQPPKRRASSARR